MEHIVNDINSVFYEDVFPPAALHVVILWHPCCRSSTSMKITMLMLFVGCVRVCKSWSLVFYGLHTISHLEYPYRVCGLFHWTSASQMFHIFEVSLPDNILVKKIKE